MNRNTERIISFFLDLLILPFIVKMVHHSMTKEDADVKKLKRASFAEFKEAFDKVDWQYDPNWPCSLFDYTGIKCNNHLHASIWHFGGVGYLMTTYGLIRVNILQRQWVKKNIGKMGKPYVK